MLISIFGIYFNIVEIIFLVTLTLYLPVALVNNKGKIKVSSSKLFNAFIFSFALYMCFLLLSSIGAGVATSVLRSFFKWMEILFLSTLIFVYIHNFTNFKRLYWAYWISSFGFIAVILLQFFIKNPLLENRIFPGYPSAFALALVLPFVKKKNKAVVVTAIICFLSAFLSLSRGVWIILLVFFILIVKNLGFKKKVWVLTLATVSLGLLIWVTPLIDIVVTRIHSEASNVERLGMANIAVRAFMENPITGIGSSNFPNYLMANANRYIIRSDRPEFLEPHNVFLQIAAEEGVFALAAFGFLLGVVYYALFKHSKFNIPDGFLPYLNGLKLLTIAITANLLFGFITDQFRLVYAGYFGLSLSLLRLAKQ